ncbi:NAD(P)-binding domain-containing protein [Aquicoccus porphyridii]|uniref:NAD(P)-binding domain-containing protein n=1 Tax=Aquicoccus porphyridii TaxID=1852029 RepID=UPI00273EAA72|nr:NAD(P)-binding domain-containing protein [Aquicoccus porphyridii]
MRIGIIGLGTIATAVVKGIAEDGHDIAVSRRSEKNAGHLAGRFGNVTVADNQEIVDRSEIVFLGLTEDVAPNVLAALRFREGQQVISLMAGLDLARVADMTAPATMAARMIPFPSIATGGSQILAHGDSSLIHALFGARNSIFEIATEEELGTYLCAQAVLSPAIRMVKDAADWLAHKGADPEMAETFLRELVGSSLLAGPCDPLLDALDTPGGYNQRLRQHMTGSGMSDRLRDGFDQLLA